MIDRLKCLEEEMVSVLELQFENLESVCTKELGEAIDIVKDLEEAIYYHTITEAMKAEKAATTHFWKTEESHDRNINEIVVKEEWDEWLGHSPHSRKRYLEAREQGKDKSAQLRELEKYMNELTIDIVGMINESSPEEKGYLEKKMTALATRIGQMK